MAVPFSNTKLRVPRGFQNLLEGLAREVLRNQPEDIHLFGAKYFEELMKIREEEGIDPVEHGAKLEDRFYNNKAFKKPDIDSGDPQQQEAAVKIQTKYRQHAATQEVQEMREDQAAIMIQSGYRGFQGRQRVLKMKDPEEYEKQKQARDARKKNKAGAAPGAEDTPQTEEEVDIDLTDPEVEKAATKIQAGFKGMKARKQVSDMKTSAHDDTNMAPSQEPASATAEEEEEEIDIDLNDPEVEKAATKIQAGFKGMKARKNVKAVKETKEAAACKIQAGFRGMRDRKRVKEIKSGEEKADAAATEALKEPEPAAKTEEEEEEIDIDLNDPEVEKAATKIQAGFKGFKARKEVEAKKSEAGAASSGATPTAEAEATPAGTEAPPAEEKKEEEEEIDIDLEDPEVEKAATKIQAGFKGLKARKEVAAMKKESEPDTSQTTEVEGQGEGQGEGQDEGQGEDEAEKPAEGEKKPEEEEEIDIDLNDPEVGKAATKIQAGFRGMQARKEVATKKTSETKGDTAGEEGEQPPADAAPAEQQPADAATEESG